MINYDKTGHCIKCGEFQFKELVLEGKKQVVPKSSIGYKNFELDNGSNMKVLMCRDCQVLPDDEVQIMKKVVKGWQHEINTFLKEKWTTAQKHTYMEKYGKLKIKSNKVDKKSKEKKTN